MEDYEKNVITYSSEKEESENTLNRYLSELNLTEECLRNKSILDLGSGVRARFASALREKGVTDRVKSVERNDPLLDGVEEPDISLVRTHAQKLPFEDNYFDMVVSVSAIPHVAYDGTIREMVDDFDKYKANSQASITQVIRECIRVVKPGAEIRLGGIPDSELTKPHVLQGVLDALDEGECEIVTNYQTGNEKHRLLILKKLLKTTGSL